MHSRTPDVRAISYIDDADGALLLARLATTDGPILTEPGLTRTAPAQSQPWFGSLRLTRVPVHVQGGAAAGHIDVQRVAVGTTEVRITLRSTSYWQRLLARGRLEQTAADILGQLTRASRVAERIASATHEPHRSHRPVSRAAARGTTQSCA